MVKGECIHINANTDELITSCFVLRHLNALNVTNIDVRDSICFRMDDTSFGFLLLALTFL